MPGEPLVSVVVASTSGDPALPDRLQALVRQLAETRIEILLVDRSGAALRSEVRRRFPEVRVVAAEGHASLPSLRATGIAEARGMMVAVLGEHFRVGPTWLAALVEAQRDGRQVVGGPIEDAGAQGLCARAFYLCEYALFMPPIARGLVPALAGNNCAYERALLSRLSPEATRDVWDAVLHARIRAAGVPFFNDPALEVSCEKRPSYGHLLSQRYHCSRAFAALRSRAWPRWKRLGFAAATLLVPALVVARLIATLTVKRRGWRELVKAFPVVVSIAVCWGCGDAVGVLLGSGRSLERVE